MAFLQELDQLVEIVNKEDNFILTSHVGPDGDNIGSIVGLALGLKQLGKNVIAVNKDITPKKYQFLINYFPIKLSDTKSFLGTVIVLDCPELLRTGLDEDMYQSCSSLINIDHHISNNYFGHLNLVDVEAAATGEIVFKLLSALDIKFDQEISTALYTAIMTDTGSFKFDNTTKCSLETAAYLLEKGANLNEINTRVYETYSLGSIRFLAAALNKMELNNEGNIAWIVVTQKMYKQFGISEEDFEGLVNYAKSVMGIEVAFIVKELENNGYKVSLRSKGDIDVNRVAGVFGGGGHKKASGFTTEDYNDVKNLIMVILVEIKKTMLRCE